MPKARSANAKGEPARTSVWSVVAVDSEPIRKKARQAYLRARRELDRLRAQLGEYRARDFPAFNRWAHRTFGALLTQIRETQRLLHSKHHLWWEVMQTAQSQGLDWAAAYEEVLWHRAHPEEPDEARGAWSTFEQQTRDVREEASAENPFKQAMNDFDDALRAALGSEETDGEPAHNGSPPTTGGRLKRLYRHLVRKLHPDSQKEMTPQKQEWWHQVQIAYEAGDVEQMQMILTLCEAEEDGLEKHASVSGLARATAQLKATLRPLRRELRQYRQEPAWQFTRRQSFEPLQEQMEQAFRSELETLRNEMAKIEVQLASWERPARKDGHRPSRARRKNRGASEEIWGSGEEFVF